MKEEKEEIPLKTILQNFLNHVEGLEVAREDSIKGEGVDQYEKEFQELKAFSDELKTNEEYSCSEGDREANRKKNRYKDILPFNYSRVTLSEYPGVPGSDYINANYIKGASGSNAYIASQGPLPHTVNDWWRLVVEKEVQVIVMACNEQEAGKHKCECYWSEDESPKQFGMYSVTLLKSREICPDFLVRTMRLSWGEGESEESRTVCQFHYSAWPDHGIPTQVKPLLEMVRLVRDCQASETLPVLVHCSAGCGRTGSICVIDYVWGLLRTGKLAPSFSLYNLVREMRRQRIAMVQTVDQYMLCHRAVKELFLEQLRVIDSHPYENVGNDGRPLVEREKNDYETIMIGKGQDVDIDKVLSTRNILPRMGVGMLSREKSPSSSNMVLPNTDTSDNSSDNSLPTTLDEFKSYSHKIHEPPVPPSNHKEPAAQRFKKGNLRLFQSEDGGWKLEELEERRRSLEALTNKADIEHEVTMQEVKAELVDALKPPQSENRKDRKKKSSREESAILRRPSIKKIKAFFDKDKNREDKENDVQSDREDSYSNSMAHKLAFSPEYASAVSKLPSLENSGHFFNEEEKHLTGSKSVPSSLDRKQRYKEPDGAQVEKSNNNNFSKYWPLKKENKASTKSISSERLQVDDKPALPVKRSKSMKSISKPVSVIPVISNSEEPSFQINQYRNEGVPQITPDTSPRTLERDEIIDLTKKSLHSKVEAQVSLTAPPPKPKRDWSSLSPDYANVEIKQTERGASDKNIKMKVVQHNSSYHDSVDSSSEFLDQQMAKLMARRGHDDTDGSSMPRSKSGDNIHQSSTIKRDSEILDDDARKMLRDCQEYLQGASFESKSKERSESTETSPRGSLNKVGGGRSVQSSPGNSYNKYSAVQRGSGVELSPHSEHSSLHSQYSESPHSETGPSSLETDTRGPEYENVCNNSYNEARGKLSAAVRVRNRERRNSFRQAVDKVDGNGRPYEKIWFQGGDNEEAGYHSMARGPSGVDTRATADTPIYVNMTRSDQKQSRKSDSSSIRSSSGHIRSGSYDNMPTPGPNTSQAIFTLEPNPTAYEIINFSPNRGDQRKQSSESQASGLQSVGLVAEALREHERSSAQPPQPPQILSKQNSAGNLRAPPPYQNPPGPPSSYNQFVSPPKHTSPSYHNQVEQSQQSHSTPKRSSMSGSSRPSQLQHPSPGHVNNLAEGMKKLESRSRPNTAGHQTQSTGDVRVRGSRSRDDTELSSRNNRNMRRNHSLDPRSSRLSLGDFINTTTGPTFRPEKPVKTVLSGSVPGGVVQGPRTAVMMGSNTTAPGVDLDRIAASMSELNKDPAGLPSSQHQPARQFGRSLAGAFSGVAHNIKSKFVNMGSSPSPPDSKARMREIPIRVEASTASGTGDRSPHAIPLTVPGAEYGYPNRIDVRPQGPRETPNFNKKQEYL